MNDYLDKLRALIPARTLALYLVGTGLVGSLAATPQEAVDKFGWFILVLFGVCLALNFVGRIVENKSKGSAVKDALWSTGAFFFLGLCQPFAGPLAALKVNSQVAFLVSALLALVYVTVIGWVYPKPVAAT